MLIALLAATYLVLALAIVLAVDQIAGLMFKIPGKAVVRRAFPFDLHGRLRRASKTQL